jgi:putative membrane protein
MTRRLVYRCFALRLAAASTALLAGTAWAHPPASPQTRDFVQAAAQSDEFEMLEGRTALAQSDDPKVRDFAKAMIQAHGRTSEQIRRAVAASGLEPPRRGISGDQSMFLAALQSARGAAFDKLYFRQQLLAHRAALAVVGDYAAMGTDAAVRQAAGAIVPVISSHLEMAERNVADQR